MILETENPQEAKSVVYILFFSSPEHKVLKVSFCDRLKPFYLLLVRRQQSACQQFF